MHFSQIFAEDSAIQISWMRHDLEFLEPRKTSRNSLTQKPGWLIFLKREEKQGVGEISLIPGLSPDDPTEISKTLNEMSLFSSKPLQKISNTIKFPAVSFALETALSDLENGGQRLFNRTHFNQGQEGILINGLIWMDEASVMKSHARKKIESGFHCIKLKIGGLDFEQEIRLLREIRNEFSVSELQIRLDANGAFSIEKALPCLERLSRFGIDSIEQPIPPGNLSELAQICQDSPIPIALDEELIGVPSEEKEQLLKTIRPAFIILKPSLLGGIEASQEWIKAAEKEKIGWWATSGLEGNIGLNRIAQWVSEYPNLPPQGLGTGQLFRNNLSSPLYLDKEKIFYDPQVRWNIPFPESTEKNSALPQKTLI